MPNINRFLWDGNVTEDVKIGYLPSHMPVAVYTVAQTRVSKREDGKSQRTTEYLRVTTYGAQAEADAAILTKGFKVTVMGRMRPWTKDGKSGVDFIGETVIYQNDVKTRRYGAMLGIGQDDALAFEHHSEHAPKPASPAA